MLIISPKQNLLKNDSQEGWFVMKQLAITDDLYHYLLDKGVREHPVLQALREDTLTHPLAHMQIAPEQAQFMQFLLKILSAKKVLELGTFAGYSALAMALALPDDGQVITCDINTEWTKNAKIFWQKAHQEHKIELRLGQASDTLATLFPEFKASFDFIFIDADKTNYKLYYEQALKLIRPGGIIAIDNVLWGGRVIDDTDTRGQTREIRELNTLLAHDTRVEVSLIPIADGLFLVTPK